MLAREATSIPLTTKRKKHITSVEKNGKTPKRTREKEEDQKRDRLRNDSLVKRNTVNFGRDPH